MIPVYINNWNILTWVKKMAAYLENVPDVAIFIIDNNSTYRPLLDWYQTCPYDVIRLRENLGSRHGYNIVLKGNEHKNKFGSDFFVFTDADLDISDCPSDILEILKEGYSRHNIKTGLSIEIEDVPEESLTYDGVVIDRCYWEKKLDDLFYDSPVDTTFALYHKDSYLYGCDAIRSEKPYTAKHLPWYFTANCKMTDEEKFMYSQKPTMCGSGGQWTNRLYQHVVSQKVKFL